MRPELFLSDLEAKPASLRALATELDNGIEWPSLGGTHRVVFLGMGSSRYAADVIALRLRAAGFNAFAEYASAEQTVPADESTLVIAISATGASPETLDAASVYLGVGRLLALTNTATSPLADMADMVVPMHAGVEVSGVACGRSAHATDVA